MNTYPVDPENAVEMARLLNQHALITSAIGGAFAMVRGDVLARLQDILDLACGPGGWVIDAARSLPSTSVTGIDVSSILLDYGGYVARTKGLSNTHFRRMDIRAPLLFPDDSFDLISGRILSSILTLDDWPAVLREAWRVCRTRGIIYLLDHELPVTNSPACERLHQLYARAYQMTGRSPITSGNRLEFIDGLPALVQNARFEAIQEHRYTLDLSAQTPLHTGFYQNLLSAFKVFEPFITGLQLIDPVHYQRVYQQMLKEVAAPGFQASCDLLLVLGEKL